MRDSRSRAAGLLKRLREFPRDALRWFRTRYVKGYMHHVVHTDLPPGYHDTDMMVLYANMALVKWYVEKDAPIAGEESFHAKCRDILAWFERYKARDDEMPTPECKCVGGDTYHTMCEHWHAWAKANRELHEKYEAEAEEHLVWIMRNRRGMWS